LKNQTYRPSVIGVHDVASLHDEARREACA